MKLIYKIAGILFFSFIIGCKGKISDEVLKKEFVSIIQFYYINYPEIKSFNDVQRFKMYLEANYEDPLIQYEKYTITLDSFTRVLHIKLQEDYFNRNEIAIDLHNEIGVPNRCGTQQMNAGPFSKRGISIEPYSILSKIHKRMIALDSMFCVSTYDKKTPRETKSGILFVYEYDKLSVFCVKNNVAEATVLLIAKELEKIIEEEETLPFDFAFIPIEVIE